MTTGTTFLQRVLQFDAATCAAMGAGLVLGAAPLGQLLELPISLLRTAGVLLLPFAALLLWTARNAQPRAAIVHAIIAANLAWAFASVAVLLGEFVLPNALGMAFMAGQAVAVAIIADLEAMALRRARVATA